jgi:hypothetical protein
MNGQRQPRAWEIAAMAAPAAVNWRDPEPWGLPAHGGWADRYREALRREAEARAQLAAVVEERERKERSVTRTRLLKEDLIAATWHPDRFLTWCLTPVEAADMIAPWTGAP